MSRILFLYLLVTIPACYYTCLLIYLLFNTIPSLSISYKRLLKPACQLEAKVLPSRCSRSLLLPCNAQCTVQTYRLQSLHVFPSVIPFVLPCCNYCCLMKSSVCRAGAHISVTIFACISILYSMYFLYCKYCCIMKSSGAHISVTIRQLFQVSDPWPPAHTLLSSREL